MGGMEFNKIFAAVLVAGIVASFSGFAAYKLVHPHELHEDAVKIEVAEGGSEGGSAAKKGPDPILALIAAADIAKGEKISKACTACHSFDKGGPNGTGPNLWGIVGKPHSAVAGFEYSDALKAKAGHSWSYAEMNHFFWKPKDYAPGTKMNFIGLKKPEDRAALIAWLRTMSGSPAALPTDAEIAAEQAALAPPLAAEDAAAEGAAADAAAKEAEKPAAH